MARPRLRTTGRLLAAALVVGAAVVGSAAVAGAEVGSGDLYISQFEGTANATGGGRNSMDFVWTGEPALPSGIEIFENGEPVALDGPPTAMTRERNIVFVVDSGEGMDAGNVLPQVREAILAQARAFPTIDYAIVQAGDQAEVRTDFTNDVTRLSNALDAIGPTNGSAVWNSLTQAAAMLGERSRVQPNIVLVTADNDGVEPENAPVARSAVMANAVMLQVAAYGGQGSQLADPTPYDELLAATTGGSLTLQPDRESFLGALRGAVSTVAERQYKVSWTSTVPAGESLHVQATIGDSSAEVDVLAGRGIYRGYQQLHPDVGVTQATLPLVDNPAVLGLALILVLVGVAGAAYALTTMFVQSDLTNVLQPYADAYGLIEGETEEQSASVLPKSALMQRAVALTEQVAESQGLLTRAEAALERANLPLRAGEALFVYVIVVVALTIIPLVLTRSLVPALFFGGLGAVVPLVVVGQIATQRRKKFLSQLPDTLSLLSGTLKAGYSLMQGVEAVSQEVGEPMGLELRRVVTESRLGRPLEESLEASADRMDSPDFAWAVMAIRIQREVGGNLAELLMTVADTMIARERLRRDVAALTAEGRVSAYMLAAMPPILTAVMYVLNQEYVSTLFRDALGIGLVIVAGISMIIGFFWMKKIITIEI